MILGKEAKHWEDLGAFHTGNEINQQPDTWKTTVELIESRKEEIEEFVAPFKNGKGDVILTGAGTSAFVGNTAEGFLFKAIGTNVRAIATTDLTTDPTLYVSEERPTLLVSFARSGNSPESVASVESINKLYPNTKHVFITCNVEGKLSQRGTEDGRNLSLVLDSRTNDKSLAMTSSFSNMYLALILAFNTERLDECVAEVEKVIELAEQVLNEQHQEIQDFINDYNFERIVYLGSDALKGIAQESALKMLELTGGQVTTMFDTPLGFRHGPKSVINSKTASVIFLSDDDYVRKYELDLINEVAQNQDGSKVVVISNTPVELPDTVLNISLNGNALDSAYLALVYVVFGQLLGFFKSINLDINPDTPSPSGQINRVVKGVTIYPL